MELNSKNFKTNYIQTNNWEDDFLPLKNNLKSPVNGTEIMRRALPCLTLKMESKYYSNKTGKEVCYDFGFLDTETFTIKGSFVFRRIYFSIHPRARVWDISISLNCVVITLFLLIVF